jgi:hypothetical protein
VLHALREALAEGCSAIDLLGSDSRWKRETATDSPVAVSVCVFSANQLPCRACRLVRGELKSWLARRAPSLLTLMRRLRPHTAWAGAKMGARRHGPRAHAGELSPGNDRGFTGAAQGGGS